MITTFGKVPDGTKFFLLILRPGETKPTPAGLPRKAHDVTSGTYTYTKVTPFLDSEFYLCNATHNYGRGYLPPEAQISTFNDVVTETKETVLDAYPVSPSESFIIY